MGKAIAGCEGKPVLGVRRLGTRLLSEVPEPRPDYLKAFWNVVNWDEVAKNYDAAK